MRALVCGSRTFTDCEFMYGALDDIHKDTPITVLIEGEARGADIMARHWADAQGIKVEPHPADWQTYGRSAGPIRNKQMLVEGKPDVVIAFLDKPVMESRGTRDMLTQAHDAGVETLTLVWEDK